MVMKDPMTNKSRGFGFLTFLDPRNVDAVLKEDHHLDGKMVPLPLLSCLWESFFLFVGQK
jgi:RNA recognition motif-containing protein